MNTTNKNLKEVVSVKIIHRGQISAPLQGKLNYNAWGSIFTLDGGEMISVWSGDRYAHICPFGRVLAARSTDGGYTWTPPYAVQNTPLDDRDAGVVQAGDRILLTSFNNSRAQQTIYANNGKYPPDKRAFVDSYLGLVTDEDEKKYLGATLAVSRDNGYTFSDPKPMPITSPHGPMVESDGTLLWIGRRFSDSAPASFPYLDEGIYAMRLNTEGEVIEEPWLIVPASEDGALYCEPHAARMPDGSILCAIRVQKYSVKPPLFTVYLCRSTDGGQTFTTPQPTGWNGSPPHILVTKSGAVVMTYARRQAPFAECARISTDSGATWSEEIVLDDTALTGDIGYPCTAENEKGELVTVYYQNTPGQGSQIYSIIWKVD